MGKKELEELYGIPTTSMFDKKELVSALKEARLNNHDQSLLEELQEQRERNVRNYSDGQLIEETMANKSPDSGITRENGDVKSTFFSRDDGKKNKGENWSSRWKKVATAAKRTIDNLEVAKFT